MSAPVSLGYLTPQLVRIQKGPWSVIAGGVVQENTSVITDWDYSVNLVLQRELEVDLQGLLGDCRLQKGSQIYALICWTSTATRLRGAGPTTRIVEGRNVLNLELNGDQLGGDLRLEARVVLGEYVIPLTELAPDRHGNTLWSDSTSVALEGSGSRYPTLPVAFSTAGLAGGRNGLWCLVAQTGDLAASGSGSLRLYLNSENTAIQVLLEDPTAEQSKILSEFIRFDVARQMLFHGLRHEELDLRTEYEPGSIGEVLAGFIRRFFPQRELASLQGDLRTAPGELEAELQAQIGLLR